MKIMKHAHLIKYSHHAFENPKLTIMWLDKMFTNSKKFEKTVKEQLSKVEKIAIEEITILESEFLGESVSTIETYLGGNPVVIKANVGDLLFEVKENRAKPICWSIDAIERDLSHEIYYRLSNTYGKLIMINQDIIDTSTEVGFYSREEDAIKARKRIKETKGE